MPPLKTRLWSRWGSPPLRLANARPHPRLHRRALSTTCIKKQPSLGSTNRLAPGPSQARKGAGSCFKIEDAEDDKFLELPDSLEPSSRGLPVNFLSKSLRRQLRRWRASWADVWGKASYRYYNWRQDTLSDLQLFVVFNFVLFCLGAWIEGTIMKRLDGRADEPSTDGAPEWWADFYSVMGWVLGQDLPQSNEVGLPSQVFAVLTVVLGLASFALVLALIEQVVLEVLESNVKRGSAVYEKDHTVVLAWCESSYDLSQLSRMLWQLVHGARGSSNNVVVVLTQNREKLEMEALFREAIPPPERLGTKFVFRQGSPLEPIALQMVAATKARAVIVCGDGARSSLDSDAECLRAAVLLDEMITAEVGLARGPRIVVQIKSPDPVPVLKYACSPRVIGVPTMVAQARRVSRMLRQPIAGLLSNMLLNYSSKAHVAIHAYPQLVGLPFQELHAYFPYAVLVGILNSSTGYSKINPDPHKVLQLGDELMMLRPGPAAYCPAAAPLEQPPCVDLGGWDPSQYFLESQDEDPLGISSLTASESLDGGRPTPPPQQRGLADFASTQAANEGEEGSSDDENSGLLLSARKALGYLGRAAGRSEGPPQQPQQSQGYFVLPLQIGGWKLGLATSDLLICGWGGASFMWTLLEELDHGPEALAPGTTVTLVNNHDNLPGLVDGQWVSRGIENLKLNHVKADPRSRTQLQNALDIGQYKACIVLTDLLWLEAGGASQGAQAQALTQPEMLRLEAATLLVQMNVRYLLQEAGLPEFGFIVEKMTSSGSTRFEDPYRLPQGLPINHTTFCAKILGGAAFDPRFLKPYSELGTHSGLVVQDSSAFAAVGEEISFLQLQARAAAVRQCVIGYYSVPDSTDTPLDVVINPQGLAARSRKQVFNRGDLGCKVVSLALTKAIRSSKNGTLTSSVGSRDFEEHPAESRAGQAAAEERLPDEGAVAAAAATD